MINTSTADMFRRLVRRRMAGRGLPAASASLR
jgi:hypothetical protein